MVSSRGRARRLVDLLTAIRANKRDRLFVVLGDPGSGKSVALRALCEKMAHEVRNNGKVPLYINLKEWSTKDPWTPDDPPKLADLEGFVVDNLKRRLGVFGADFIDKFYNRMLANGMFFVVFDSFDEIPAILDVDDSSWLIEALSGIFGQFFFGETESRGVLASRNFRQPRFALRRKVCTLDIRPFNETKIARSFLAYPHVTQEHVNTLFGARIDLIPLARNPFTAGLIIDFLNQPGHRFPASQSEIYGSYIKRRLDVVTDMLVSHDLSVDAVVDCATKIAGVMFDSANIGLDIGTRELEHRLAGLKVPEVIEVLVAGRIGRRGGAAWARFSFVHRRFNEYFFVQYLISSGEPPSLEPIPLDSKRRDALVLYAEVCPTAEAERIANYCWEEMNRTRPRSAHPPASYLRHVHCLRFLSAAFHGRTEALTDFRDNLFDHIRESILSHESLLFKNLSVEAAGLLNPNEIEEVAINALSLGNEWISENTLNACRYIAGLSTSLLTRMAYYLSSLPPMVVLRRYAEIRFSLTLSPGMAGLSSFSRARLADVVVYSVALGTMVLFMPGVFLMCLLAYGLIESFRAQLRSGLAACRTWVRFTRVRSILSHI